MKRSLRGLAAAAVVAGVIAVPAPGASAQDCTTKYVDALIHSETQPLVEYTPPATITINGNAVVGLVSYVAGATITYVDCVV